MKHKDQQLNALRMGVIPSSDVQTLMVGKRKEKEEVANFIQTVGRGGSQVRFFNGPYGSGKTFMLKYLSEVALSQNYIVANIPIHSGFGFSKLDGIYTNVMNHLSVRLDDGKGSSFERIFDYWIDNLKASGNMSDATRSIYSVIKDLNDYNSSFSNVLLTYIRAKINNDFDLANTAAAWIKGDQNMSYQLKKQLKVKGSVDKENALDVFKGFVRLMHLMGYKGVIVTFDEAELIMQQRVDIRLKAYGNMRQLIDSSGMGELDYCGFIFAGTPEFFENEEKGVKSYQALYQRIGELIKGSADVVNMRQPVIELKKFTKEDYTELSHKVIKIHQEIGGYELGVPIEYMVNLVMLESSKLIKEDGLTIRIYLKKLLELLDLLKDNPDLPIFKAMRRRSD